MSDEVLDVLDLEAACERKDAEIERLTAEVEKLRDPKLSHMRFENGRLDMALVSPVIEGLATALGGWFVDNGAKNYVEMRLHDRHETGQVYILTVQKSGAKTPHELRTEAENKAAAEIASLKAEVERLRAVNALMEYAAFPTAEEAKEAEEWIKANPGRPFSDYCSPGGLQVKRLTAEVKRKDAALERISRYRIDYTVPQEAVYLIEIARAALNQEPRT
jgi:cell division protein FtsB